MRIEIDTDNKTVRLLESVSIQELSNFLDSLSTSDELHLWKIIPDGINYSNSDYASSLNTWYGNSEVASSYGISALTAIS